MRTSTELRFICFLFSRLEKNPGNVRQPQNCLTCGRLVQREPKLIKCYWHVEFVLADSLVMFTYHHVYFSKYCALPFLKKTNTFSKKLNFRYFWCFILIHFGKGVNFSCRLCHSEGETKIRDGLFSYSYSSPL